jgi:hypothetical protein
MDLVILSIAVIGSAGVYFALRFWPRSKNSIDQIRLTRFFDGLARFGKDGARVYLAGPKRGMKISFTKLMSVNSRWYLEVALSGHPIPREFYEEMSRALTSLGDRFVWEWTSPFGGNETTRLRLSGRGVQDPVAMEGIARHIVARLGHPPDSLYRADFDGPKDYQEVNEYFGFKR